MGFPISSLGTLFRHPIFLIAVIGITVRLVLAPFLDVGYDTDYWATIIRNLESGEGLYGLEGYYYTPVWGYILSFLSVLQGSFLNIDVMGLRVLEAFPAESYTGWFFSATVTSVAFNLWIKIPLIICDLIVGYLIYWLIKDKTQDMRKATIGFALWFLCPLVIFVTSVSAMFDTFSVLFTLLCIIMIRKDKLFLAGVLFSFAVLTKFFPAYTVFILVAYIYARHSEDGKAFKSVLVAMAGAVLGFLVIMAPQILHGELSESILFITSRASSGSVTTLFEEIRSMGAMLMYAVGGIVAAYLGLKLKRESKEKLDDSLFKYLLLMTAFLFLYPPLPQYLVLLIPFLAIFLVTSDSRLKWSWALISLGGVMLISGGNFTLFLSLGTFTDIMSLGNIISMAGTFQDPVLFGLSPTFLLYFIGGAIQYAGILSVFWFFIKDRYLGSRKEQSVAD